MPNLILAGLFGCVLVASGIYMYSRIVYWRSSYEVVDGSYAEATSLLIVAERDRAKAEKDAEFLQNVMIGISRNPVQAVITDQQLNQLCEMILANMTSPEELN